MKHLKFRLMNIALTSAWLACVVQPAGSTEPREATVKQEASSAAGRTSDAGEKGDRAKDAGSGMKVFIDPKTGKISKPPRDAVAAESSQKFTQEGKEKAKELRETPSPRPGGGGVVDLKGRFNTPLTATRDADGKLIIKHRSDNSGSNENK